MSQSTDSKDVKYNVYEPTPSPTDEGLGQVEEIPTVENFNLWSTLGMAYSITCTPISIGTYLSVSVGVGGSPVFVYGYLLSVMLNLCICFSLAELAAVYPHSSGQIFWTATLAPRKISRGLSYFVGWLTSAGYFFWTAAACLITSQLVFALVQICKTTFVSQPWHFYLGYVATALFGFALNMPPLFKLYPYMLKGLVGYINIGALFVMIALLVRAHPKQSAEYVFTDLVNLTGWSSNGVVFFLGLLPGLTAVNGFDSAAHLAEELPNPRRQVPQVMIGCAVSSAVAGFIMLLVYMFSITNPDNLLVPVGGQPIAQLMVDSLDSLALTIIGMLIFIVTFLCAAAAEVTATSRIWWSLSREHGTPFSKTLGRWNDRANLPINSIIFIAVAVVLLGLLELGSTTALNAILGAGILCIFVSYAIPIVCLLLERRASFDAPHYCNLGRFGYVLNCISVAWVAFTFVWLCFPLYVPVTATTMNFAIAVFAGVCFVSTVNWFAYSRRVYTAPTALAMRGNSIALGRGSIDV